MVIFVLTDNERSWFVPYGKKIVERLRQLGHEATYVFHKKDVKACDIFFMLSCTKLVDTETLAKNQHNIVVHASDLPKGKGFSPLQWQILEGQNRITLTLFEAVKEIDAGPYYFKDVVEYDGTELHDEMRQKLGEKIVEMCVRFVKDPTVPSHQQVGESTYYRKRTVADDELDVNRTIAEQFDHFRIADNEQHPLWFKYRGAYYFLRISKASEPPK